MLFVEVSCNVKIYQKFRIVNTKKLASSHEELYGLTITQRFQQMFLSS